MVVSGTLLPVFVSCCRFIIILEDTLNVSLLLLQVSLREKQGGYQELQERKQAGEGILFLVIQFKESVQIRREESVKVFAKHNLF